MSQQALSSRRIELLYLEPTMPVALAFFVHYAYGILFLWVLVEQLGVPVPSIPVLLTAGTLDGDAPGEWAAVDSGGVAGVPGGRFDVVCAGAAVWECCAETALPAVV